jgi:hypothetical protein
MKKISIALCLLLLLAIPFTAGAVTINTNFATPGDDLDGYTSPYAVVQVFNFNDATGLSGNYQLVTGSVVNWYAAPYGQGAPDHTQYLSVPLGYGQSYGDPVASLTGFGMANYLGLWWGSMDAYNTFTFFNGEQVVYSLTGSDVISMGAPFGDQIQPGSNHYVNFLGLPNFNKVTFSSSEFAFEVDNVAVGVVPEPTTMLLLGLGVLGLAGFRKRLS